MAFAGWPRGWPGASASAGSGEAMGIDPSSFAELMWLLDGDEDDLPAIDGGTAERLLSGRLPPAQAPPGWEEVAALLGAAVAEPSPDELAGKATAVARLAAAARAHRPATSRPPPLTSRRRRPLAVAAVAVALMTAGTAVAATGHLPEPIRVVARELLAVVGLGSPGTPAEPVRQRGPSTGEPGAGGGGQRRRAPSASAADDRPRGAEHTGGPAAVASTAGDPRQGRGGSPSAGGRQPGQDQSPSAVARVRPSHHRAGRVRAPAPRSHVRPRPGDAGSSSARRRTRPALGPPGAQVARGRGRPAARCCRHPRAGTGRVRASISPSSGGL